MIGKVVSWLLLLAGIASLAGAAWWVAEGRQDPEADIAGFRPYVIATGSMAPEYEVNALVLTRETPFDEVEEGDVVAFSAAAMGGDAALHRVVQIVRDGAGRPVSMIVKGDNNPHPDGSPVTEDNYLGTAVAHTNVSAFVVQQYRAPGGLLRVVVIPVAVLGLTWFALSELRDGRRTRTGRALVTVGVVAVILTTATISYARYLDQKEDHVVSTLDGYAAKFEETGPEVAVSIGQTAVNGTIDIPSIDVHYPVIEYVAASSLNVAITHFSGPGLNQPGNVVLAGHRAWGNLYFTRIDQLEKGDVIWVTDSHRDRVQYVVTGHREVTSDDTSVLRQPRGEHEGERHLTLISCTYDLRNRYIVEAVAAEGHRADEEPVATHTEDEGLLPGGAAPATVGVAGLALVTLFAWAAVALRRRRDEEPGTAEARAGLPG